MDKITTQPTLIGKAGCAWEMDFSQILKSRKIEPEDSAMLSGWVIEAPWAHPIWHSYSLVLVHLREMPDKRKTFFYLDGATHEFWLHALDPNENRQEVIDGQATHHLTPVNFAAQIVRSNDEIAIAEIRETVEDIIDGKLSPDTDFRQDWIARFGDSMIKKQYKEKRL